MDKPRGFGVEMVVSPWIDVLFPKNLFAELNPLTYFNTFHTNKKNSALQNPDDYFSID